MGVKDGLGSRVQKSKYDQLVKEVYEYATSYLFTDLSPCEGRVELLSHLLGTTVTEGIYMVHLLHKTLESPGEVCEFGVAQGTTSALLANEIRLGEKELWLFDTFEGLPKPGTKDVLLDDVFDLGSMAKYEGQMPYPASEARGRVRATGFPLPRTHIVVGDIRKTLKGEDIPGSVCFAYVDVDLYESCRAALQFLHKTLVPGGIIVVDDYDFFSSGMKASVEEFLDDHSEHYEITVPTKHGLHLCILDRRTRGESKIVTSPRLK